MNASNLTLSAHSLNIEYVTVDVPHEQVLSITLLAGPLWVTADEKCIEVGSLHQGCSTRFRKPGHTVVMHHDQMALSRVMKGL